ncbi:MAG: tetratricopeptide repeat protein, partial [Candidatus Eisenbacteria bacterium]
IATHGYALLPGGAARMGAVQPAAATDSMVRRALEAELERSVTGSRASSRARYLLGGIAALEGRLDDAEREFRLALVADPVTRRVHEGLGAIAAAGGRHAAAVTEYLAEGAIGGWPAGVRARLGDSYAALGRRDEARRAYRAELADDPGNAAARDSLAALEAKGR